jgi:hypothetical protein
MLAVKAILSFLALHWEKAKLNLEKKKKYEEEMKRVTAAYLAALDSLRSQALTDSQQAQNVEEEIPEKPSH